MPTGIYKRKPFSEEHKKKIGLANSISMKSNTNGKGCKGRIMPEAQRQKLIGNKNTYGKHWKHSEVAKQNMSKAHIGIKLSEKHKRKISEGRKGKYKGENNSAWKGGITPELQKRINNPVWKIIRKKVYKRDNWTCQICGIHCGNEEKSKIQCHHIIPYRITQDNSESNLITLCASCHGKEEHKYYKRLK